MFECNVFYSDYIRKSNINKASIDIILNNRLFLRLYGKWIILKMYQNVTVFVIVSFLLACSFTSEYE